VVKRDELEERLEALLQGIEARARDDQRYAQKLLEEERFAREAFNRGRVESATEIVAEIRAALKGDS
jgi:hypothetical protein